MTNNLPKKKESIRDFIERYQAKCFGGTYEQIDENGFVTNTIEFDGIENSIQKFKDAYQELVNYSGFDDKFGESIIERDYCIREMRPETIEKSIRIAAWKSIYSGLNIDGSSTAKDRKRLETFLLNPPELTIENVRKEFGDRLIDPRTNMLKGIAEIFCSLDNSYKSHSKVKFGVEKLPKRIIMSYFSVYGGYTSEKLKDMVNAILMFRNKKRIKPQVFYNFLHKIDKERNIDFKFMNDEEHHNFGKIKLYLNGNIHIIFSPDVCKDINLALAEYYGDVLFNDSPSDEDAKSFSTAISNNLAFYPTPEIVANKLAEYLFLENGNKILEPSCGEGALMIAIEKQAKKYFKDVDIVGVEYDVNRAAISRSKGFTVKRDNFLDVEPIEEYDYVAMNPPFNGKHYQNHIQHALKFLKKGGKLVAILPANAQYHDENDFYSWVDLPVGSFSSSGTNVSTGIATVFKK